MALLRNLAVVALVAGAYASNPKEPSFQQFIEHELERDKRAGWLERKVVSHLSARLWKRRDYYLFSLVRVPEDHLTFLGCFGHWFHLPLPAPKPRPGGPSY